MSASLIFGARLIGRDLRGGELRSLSFALALAVAIVSGMSIASQRIEQGLRADSNRYLAADASLSSRYPAPQAWFDRARALGLREARSLSFQSMLFAGDAMRLVSLRAVNDGYPLAGEVLIKRRLGADSAASLALSHGPPPSEIWLDEILFELLGIELGALVEVGNASLRASAVLVSEPDRSISLSSFGARALMHSADVEATEVVRPGSRLRYAYLLSGASEPLKTWLDWVRPQLHEQQRLIELGDAQPSMSRALMRAEQFFRLAAALAMVIAVLAILLALRQYLSRQHDVIAILKTLGAQRRQVIALYLGGFVFLALLAFAVGIGIALLLQAALFSVLVDFFNFEPAPLNWKGLAPGAALVGLVIACFVLPQVGFVARCSPLRVLRRDVDPQSRLQPLSWLFSALGVLLLMRLYLGYWGLAWITLALCVALLAGLSLLAWGLFKAGSASSPQVGSAWLLAWGNLRRSPGHSVLTIAAFALSFALAALLWVARGDLLNDFQRQMKPGMANIFALNIAPHERQGFVRWFEELGREPPRLYSTASARLLSVDDRALIKKNFGPNPERDLSLGSSLFQPVENEVVAGSWWPEDESRTLVSLEEGFAKDIGARIGSKLRFRIADRVFEAPVHNLRRLDWLDMNPNFFVLLSPAGMKDIPIVYMTSFYLPPKEQGKRVALARAFPTVSLIDVNAALAQGREILGRLGGVVSLVAVLMLISASLIMAVTARFGIEQRRQGNAVLRALGAPRSLIVTSLGIEYAILGACSGVLAAGVAELGAWLIQTQVFELNGATLHPWLWWALPVCAPLILVVLGSLLIFKTTRVSPLLALREEHA